MSKVLKYFMLTLCICFVAVILVAAYAVLVPGTVIFGYKYVYIKCNNGITTLNLNKYPFNKIVIDSPNTNINIHYIKVKNADTKTSEGVVYANIKYTYTIQGFYKVPDYDKLSDDEKKNVQDTKYFTEASITDENNTLACTNTISAKDVYAFTSNNTLDIEIQYDDSQTYPDLLESISIIGGDYGVSVGSKDSPVNATKTSITTTSGSQNLYLLNANADVTAVSTKGAITINSTVDSLNDVNITTNSGKIDLLQEINTTATAGTVQNCTITAKNNPNVNLCNVASSLKYIGKNGYVTANEINNATLTIEDVSTDKTDVVFSAKKVTGEFNSSYGDHPKINIEKLVSTKSIVTAVSGDTTINSLDCQNFTFISDNTANLTVEELVGSVVSKNILAASKNGNIKIKYINDTAEQAISGKYDYTQYYKFDITLSTINGTVAVYNAYSKLTINVKNDGSTTGKGIVFAELLRVDDNVTINGANGNVNLFLPISDYKLTTTSNSSVNIELGSISINENRKNQQIKTTSYKVNSFVGDNPLLTAVTNDGALNIKANTAMSDDDKSKFDF
jgi:hypothetical protein